MDSERNPHLIGTATWTRGDPNGYELDNSPFYKRRLNKSDSDSFIKNRIFIKISDLIEKDTDTYFCSIRLMGEEARSGNGTKLEVKRRIQGENSESSNLEPFLGGALAILVITVMILIFRIIWQNKVILRLKRNHRETNPIYETVDPQPTTQVRPLDVEMLYMCNDSSEQHIPIMAVVSRFPCIMSK
ncbi:natural cytotoxicity triggering receptor 3-like isoform X2 [Heptranchias perlo]|uniref:natural cytotoxicity triggering receptor 3-like isoform X2 n=1 Tax=Heptranchias perlo TaxID=212740 RepID=UPI00355952AA